MKDTVDTYDFQHLKSTTLGTYRPNALFVKINTFCDLEPEFGEVLQDAVAVHVHEYIHYLHNVSTVAGQYYLFSHFMFLRYMVSGCDKNGHFIGGNAQDELLSSLSDISKTTYTFLGTNSLKKIANNIDISELEISIPIRKINNDGVPEIHCELYLKNKENIKEDIIIGYVFITEGIAYEIEREIRKKHTPSDKIDVGTPAFPYLAYRKAIELWTGRKFNTKELVDISVTALSSFFPGDLLFQICEDLKSMPAEFDLVLKKYKKDNAKRYETIIKMLIEQNEAVRKNKNLKVAMKEYIKMSSYGMQIRVKNWLAELDFIENSNDKYYFYSSVYKKVDYNLIQEKPCDKARIDWIGPSKIAKTEKEIRSIAVLQSMLHFSQLHMTTNGVIPNTVDLRNERCPFSGACVQEGKFQKDDDYKSIENCQKKPWMNFLSPKSNELVCWYASGVRGLINPKLI
ncbi:hypothetical protein AB7V86_03150 [Providencia rettgeri]